MALTEQVEELVQPLLVDLGFELVDLEYKREQQGWTLRFYLDKDGGITLDDCAAASREISSLLDVEDIIPTAYSLEVSSPGIERPLKKAIDFDRFSGQLAKIKTLFPIDPAGSGKQQRSFVGILGGIEGGQVILQTQGPDNKKIKIDLQQIEKANLKYEF